MLIIHATTPIEEVDNFAEVEIKKTSNDAETQTDIPNEEKSESEDVKSDMVFCGSADQIFAQLSMPKAKQLARTPHKHSSKCKH